MSITVNGLGATAALGQTSRFDVDGAGIPAFGGAGIPACPAAASPAVLSGRAKAELLGRRMSLLTHWVQ